MTRSSSSASGDPAGTVYEYSQTCYTFDSLDHDHVSIPEFSHSLGSSSSSLFSDIPSSHRWGVQRNSTDRLVPVMLALIADLEEMSNDLSEIQDDLKSLGLPKCSINSPTIPRFVYTPATPELLSEEAAIELEDWEMEEKLNVMMSEVELMYLDIVEMSEEGLFPDGVPNYLRSDELPSQVSSDLSCLSKSSLQPEDVMLMLKELAIPEMLEQDEELDCWSDSESSIQDEDLFGEDGEASTKHSQSWPSIFDSDTIPSSPSPSDTEDDIQTISSCITSQRSIIFGEDILRSSHSPLSQLIHSYPAMKRRATNIRPSPTVSFTPAPSPQPRNIVETSPLLCHSTSSLFSEPVPLLPFSIQASPESFPRNSNVRNSFWNKFKGFKKQKSFSDTSSNNSIELPSPLKRMFGSPNRRSTANNFNVDPTSSVYNTTSVKGTSCIPRS